MDRHYQQCDTNVLKTAIEKFEERNKALERRETAIMKMLLEIEKEKYSSTAQEDKIKEVISDSKGILSEMRPEEVTFYNEGFHANPQDNLYNPRSRDWRSPHRGPDRGGTWGISSRGRAGNRPYEDRYRMTWSKDCSPRPSLNSFEKQNPASLQDYKYSSDRDFKANSGVINVREMSPGSLRREMDVEPKIRREAFISDPDVERLRELADMEFPSVDKQFPEYEDRGIKARVPSTDSMSFLKKDNTSLTEKEFSCNDEKDISDYMKSVLSPSVQEMITGFQKRQQIKPLYTDKETDVQSRPFSRESTTDRGDQGVMTEVGTLWSSPSRRTLHTDTASICTPYTDSDKESNDCTVSNSRIQRWRSRRSSRKNKRSFMNDNEKFTYDPSPSNDGNKPSPDRQINHTHSPDTVDPAQYKFDDEYDCNFLVFLVRNCLPKALFKNHYDYKYNWSDEDKDDILNKLDEIEIVKRIFRADLDYREKVESPLKLKYDDRRVLLRNIMYADAIKRGFAKGIPVCEIMALFTETRALGNIKEFTLQILRQANELLGEVHADPVGLKAIEKAAVERLSKLKETCMVPETPQSNSLRSILQNIIKREAVLDPCEILEKCIRDMKNLVTVDDNDIFDEIEYLSHEIHRLKNIIWSIGEFMTVKELREKSNKVDCDNNTPTSEVASESDSKYLVDYMGPGGVIKENDWFNEEVERIKNLINKLEKHVLPSAVRRKEESNKTRTKDQNISQKENNTMQKITSKECITTQEVTPKEDTMQQKVKSKVNASDKLSCINEDPTNHSLEKVEDNTSSNHTIHQRKYSTFTSSQSFIKDDSLQEEPDLKTEVKRLKSLIGNIEHLLDQQPVSDSESVKHKECAATTTVTNLLTSHHQQPISDSESVKHKECAATTTVTNLLTSHHQQPVSDSESVKHKECAATTTVANLLTSHHQQPISDSESVKHKECAATTTVTNLLTSHHQQPVSDSESVKHKECAATTTVTQEKTTCEVSVGHRISTSVCSHTVCLQHQHQQCHHGHIGHIHKKVYYLVKNRVSEGSHVSTSINTEQNITVCTSDKMTNVPITPTEAQNTEPTAISASSSTPTVEVKNTDSKEASLTHVKPDDTVPSNKELIEEINHLREIIKCINTDDIVSPLESVHNVSDITIASSDYQDRSSVSTSLSAESSLCSNCRRDMLSNQESNTTFVEKPSNTLISKCSDCHGYIEENMESSIEGIINQSSTSCFEQNSNHADDLWSNMVDAVITHPEVNINQTSARTGSKERKPPHVNDSAPSVYSSAQSLKSSVNEDVYHIVHESGSAFEIQSTSNIHGKASKPSFHNESNKLKVENIPQQVAKAVKIFSESESAAQCLKQAIKQSCLATYEQAINEALKDVLKCFPFPGVASLNDEKITKKLENKRSPERRGKKRIGLENTTLSDCSGRYKNEDILVVGMTGIDDNKGIESNSSIASLESIDLVARKRLSSPAPDNYDSGDDTIIKKHKLSKQNKTLLTTSGKEIKSVTNDSKHGSLLSNSQKPKLNTTVSNLAQEKKMTGTSSAPHVKKLTVVAPSPESKLPQEKVTPGPAVRVFYTPPIQEVNEVTPDTVKGTLYPRPSNEMKKKATPFKSLTAAKSIFGRTEPRNASCVVRKTTDVKPLKPQKKLKTLSSSYKAAAGSRDTQELRRRVVKPRPTSNKRSEDQCKSMWGSPHHQDTGSTPSTSAKKKPAGLTLKNAEVAMLFNRLLGRQPDDRDSQEELFDADEGPAKVAQADSISPMKMGPKKMRAMKHVKKSPSCSRKFTPTVKQVVDHVQMVTKKGGNFDKTKMGQEPKYSHPLQTQGGAKKKPW